MVVQACKDGGQSRFVGVWGSLTKWSLVSVVLVVRVGAWWFGQ